jgi:hypothetical protein
MVFPGLDGGFSGASGRAASRINRRCAQIAGSAGTALAWQRRQPFMMMVDFPAPADGRPAQLRHAPDRG